MRIQFKILIAFIYCISIFLFFDRFIFKNLIFQIPNELEWDTSPWYNFLRKRSEIRFSKKENGVLVLGSSIALYSVLPSSFEDRANQSLSRSDRIRTEFYAHPSLTPSDLYYYKEDILSKQPKAIVYVLNPADFQIEYIKETSHEMRYDELEFLKDSISIRHQNRLLYPDRFLLDHWKNIVESGKSSLEEFSGKFISYGIRYRSFFYDPALAWYMHRFRWGRSYHYYTGMIPKEGIYLRGWAKPNFEIDCEISEKLWKESIFIQRPGTKVTVSLLNNKEEILLEQTYAKKGWYYIQIPFHNAPGNVRLKFQTDKSVSSKEVDARIFGTEEIYGIRLSQNFCRSSFREDLSYTRISSLDDSRIESMSDSNYDQDYDLRIYRENDEEDVLSRFKKIKIAKGILAQEKKFASWSQMKYLQETVTYFLANKIPVLLINSPENPKERSVYEKSPWYLGYLDFLKTLGGEGYAFKDARDLFAKKQFFLDPHHLTYSASETASLTFADWFLENYPSRSLTDSRLNPKESLSKSGADTFSINPE
ncbi:hypothetical protein [Leptospira semungkisensis]|uniref:hypothetical protein n=1 Tax=Leptospira semungkisensis TaxID=2484985 RepID=UPI001AEF4236|nr:hypothetical protein [Leptospira semungkisensis]